MSKSIGSPHSYFREKKGVPGPAVRDGRKGWSGTDEKVTVTSGALRGRERKGLVPIRAERTLAGI